MDGLHPLLFEDLCVTNVTIHSGVRPLGRLVEPRKNGRLCHGLVYVVNGSMTFYLPRDITLEVTGGMLAYIPKGYRYKMRYSRADTSFVLVDFDMLIHGNETPRLCDTVAVVAEDDDTHSLDDLMARFKTCATDPVPTVLFRKKELFYRLLTRICEHGEPSPQHAPAASPLDQGVLLLRQSYQENLPIAAFAKAAHMSVNTFRQRFGKQYGMPPLQYRNLLRIRRARELLSEGCGTVNEVAYACGFENIGYFCRCYKRLTGETPTETRRKGGG